MDEIERLKPYHDIIVVNQRRKDRKWDFYVKSPKNQHTENINKNATRPRAGDLRNKGA